MSRLTLRLALIATVAASAAAQAQQPSWSPPEPSQRCPSKWGANDERGSMNHMKLAAVMAATKLIRTGEVIELGHVLRAGNPLQATRQFNLHTKRTNMNPQPNQRGSNEELVTTELRQVGTQFDGFAHQTHGDSMYNCFKVSETGTRTRFTRLGVEKVGALMTRGVLIDVAALKGVETLPDSYEISVEDLQQALKRQKLTLEPGDAVIIHTGWGRLWGKDNARYMTRSPGIGVAAGEWLVKQDPMLLGADNVPVEVAPPKDPQLSGPVHQMMLVVHGIHLLENLKLDELSGKKIHEFALVVQPLKLQGGTGSTVAPIAIR